MPPGVSTLITAQAFATVSGSFPIGMTGVFTGAL
jgi:hypothetical protein